MASLALSICCSLSDAGSLGGRDCRGLRVSSSARPKAKEHSNSADREYENRTGQKSSLTGTKKGLHSADTERSPASSTLTVTMW